MKILKIKDRIFLVEVADTLWKRIKGLMFREKLPPMHGLLIEFPKKGRWEIWTLFMRFPIDLIFLDEKMQVVDVIRNARQLSLLRPKTWRIYKPKKPSSYVLEVATENEKERK